MSENGGDKGKSASLQFVLAFLSLIGVLGAAFMGLIGVLGSAFIENWEPFSTANSTSVSVETKEVSGSSPSPPVEIQEDPPLAEPTVSPTDSASDLSESEAESEDRVPTSGENDDDSQDDSLPDSAPLQRVMSNDSAMPMQDSDGYYLSWRNWSTSRSVPLQLNCRRTPTETGTVVHRFVANELMNVETESGSPMVRDNEAKPWLKVKTVDEACFVRARSRYVIPLSVREQTKSYRLNDSVLPMQDSDGYYLSWRNWSTWRSVPLQLNCRRTPTETGTVVRRFVANELMDVEMSSGSPMVRDREAKPWLKVEAEDGACFVRARSRYIVPSVQS